MLSNYVFLLVRMYDFQDNSGITPLMLAVKKQNTYCLRLLVAKNANFGLIDGDKNNVMHYAAFTTKDIIEVLFS